MALPSGLPNDFVARCRRLAAHPAQGISKWGGDALVSANIGNYHLAYSNLCNGEELAEAFVEVRN